MVRTILRYLALVLSVLSGCAAPLQHPFPLGQPEPEAAVAPAARATVLLTDGQTMCSAVFVRPTVALTARHCVRGRPSILVRPDGMTFVVTSATVASDEDIALLSVLPSSSDTAQVADVPPVGATARVLGYGCSSGRRLDWRGVRYLGRFVPPDGSELVLDLWEGVACKGDSGGGVFDADGRLVGLSVRIADATGDAGQPVHLLYTVPPVLVAPMLDRL